MLATAGLVPAVAPAHAAGGSCPTFTAVSAGSFHSLAVAAGGTAWSWGGNAFGQVGDATTTTRTNPGRVASLSNVSAVAAGAQHSLALLGDGTARGWGYNNSGQVGDNSTTVRHSPVTVSGLSNATAIAAGGYHSLAVVLGGTVRAWGENSDGQLGDNTIVDKLVPTMVGGLSGVTITAVAAGTYHSLALDSGGGVWAWGYNGFGQVGDNSTTSRKLPVKVITNGITAIGAGGYHSFAIGSTGTVYGWGWNGSGQVGDGTTTSPHKVPTPVIAVGGATVVDAGGMHSLAVASGSVRAWGANTYGQLGDGSTTTRPTPVTISGTGVSSVSAGENHSLAVSSGGAVTAWGDNLDGQLGDGTTTQRTTPTPVLCRPSIGTVTDTPDPVAVNEPLTFEVGWSSTNPSALVRAVVCKTAAISAATCSGGAWTTGSLSSSSPATATYTPVPADVGSRTYHAFACDGDNVCSSSVSGTFMVVAPACADGVDNDFDGAADYPADGSCSAPSETSESGDPECSDTEDNDGDGLADYPAEPDCSGPLDSKERAAVAPPDSSGELWSACTVRLLDSGVVVLEANATAYGPPPAQTTTVDCTAHGANGETITARGTALGPVVTATSSRVMTSATFYTCWSSSALWETLPEFGQPVPDVALGRLVTQPARCST